MRNTRIDFNQWTLHVSDEESNEFAFVIDLSKPCHLNCEFRSFDKVFVSLLNTDGELLPWASGDHVVVSGRFHNVASIMVRCDGTMASLIDGPVARYERLDPVPFAHVVPGTGSDDSMASMLRTEIQKYLAAAAAAGRDPRVDAKELFDDLRYGDLEFDDEDIDDFGSGYTEMEPELPEGSSAENGNHKSSEADDPGPDDPPDSESDKDPALPPT